MTLKSLYLTHNSDPGFDSTDAADGSKENLGFVWHLAGGDDGTLDRVWVYVGNPDAFAVGVEFCHYNFFAPATGDRPPVYSQAFVTQSSIGWQEVALTAPPAILAGVDYVANFFWNKAGHYSYKLGVFSGSSTFGLNGLVATDGRFQDSPTRRAPENDTNGQYGLDIGVTVDVGGGTVGGDTGLVDLVTAMQEVADLVTAAGVDASIDRQTLVVPGLLLGAASMDFNRYDAEVYELTLDAYLIAPGNADTDALRSLSRMLELVAPVLHPGLVTFIGMSLPNHGADPLPALTFQTTIQVSEA